MAVTIQFNKIVLSEVKDNKALLEPSSLMSFLASPGVSQVLPQTHWMNLQLRRRPQVIHVYVSLRITVLDYWNYLNSVNAFSGLGFSSKYQAAFVHILQNQ